MKYHQIIVDGYNAIHKIDVLKSEINRNLEGTRKRLATYLVRWQHDVQFRGNITVVFDGKSQNYLDSIDSEQGISFLYSYKDSDADNHIISLLKRSNAPSKILVISDDNYIRNHCRVYGAHIQSVDFLKSNNKNKKPKTQKDRDIKKINTQAKNEINAFLKKKWGIK